MRRPPGPRLRTAEVLAMVRRRAATDFLDRVAEAAPRIGYFRLGFEHMYLVSEPELVRELLVVRSRETGKGRGLEKSRVLLGQGLLTSEGDLHRRQRRLIQPAFHARRIARYAEEMTGAAVAHGSGWRSGAVVDLSAEMSRLTLRIVGRALFGSDLTGEARPVAGAVTTLLRYSPRVAIPFAMILNRVPVLPSTRRINTALSDLDRVVYRMIAERRERPGTDLLSMLLAARDEDGAAMSDTQLRDEVLTLMLAGHETTANALAWSWYLLDRNPDVARRLHAEVDALPGPPGVADLPALPVTRSVVAESMRLYPPGWIIGRRALADLELDGWPIPAGSLCAVSPWVLHRDNRWWHDPLRFVPDRWLTPTGGYDEAAPGHPRYAYLPFGAGRRVCVGEAFAWTEAALVLATLTRDWEAALTPGQDVQVFPGLTLRPAGGLWVSLHRRR